MQCFRNFAGAKNFMDSGGGAGYQDFPKFSGSEKIFSLTVPKNFAGESFNYFQVSHSRKFFVSPIFRRVTFL